MKINVLKTIRLVLLAFLVSTMPIFAFAQSGPPPPPEPPTGYHGEEGPVGGGAPIGGGLLILLALGSVYGGKKVYDLRKRKKR